MPAVHVQHRLPTSITAVLPAYNEEAIVAQTVRRTHAALAGLELRAFEIVVVDDGSTDRTRQRCEQVAAELQEVRVVSHRENRGYGAALRTGFEAATGTAIFLMDSDGQFDPSDMRLLVERWSPGAVVCGCRVARSDSWIRRLNARAFFGLVRAVMGPMARDVDCGFKLLPNAAGQGLSSDGALISTELLLRAREHGLAVVDVEVPHHPRLTGRPTGARPAVVLRAFAELLRLRADLHGHRRPVRRVTDSSTPPASYPSSTS
jgi:glycosyltransferase involved in cell wall biosynthesis